MGTVHNPLNVSIQEKSHHCMSVHSGTMTLYALFDSTSILSILMLMLMELYKLEDSKFLLFATSSGELQLKQVRILRKYVIA